MCTFPETFFDLVNEDKATENEPHKSEPVFPAGEALVRNAHCVGREEEQMASYQARLVSWSWLLENEHYYQKAALAPEPVSYCDRALSAANSVAVITGKPWREIGKSLIEQAHKRCSMPDYKVAVTDMLRANGFRPSKFRLSRSSDLMSCTPDNAPGRQFLISLDGQGYYAVMYNDTLGHYQYFGMGGPFYLDPKVLEIWEYVPGKDFRTGKYPNPKPVLSAPEEVSPTFLKWNANPHQRKIGDCSVRALSQVLGCSWHDAMDLLARESDYEVLNINSNKNISRTLRRIGMTFETYWWRKWPDFPSFYQHLNETYHNGERIFAFVGNSHCTAFCPSPKTGKYQFVDSWNCESYHIRKYWVYKPGRTDGASV